MQTKEQTLKDYAALYGAKVIVTILKVGDVVRLKTGGPQMTVVEIDDNWVTSLYYDGDELCELELPSECLATI